MKKIASENLFFLVPYLLFFLGGGVIISVYSKSDIHIFLNSNFHNEPGNYFFYGATYFGDGVAVVAFILLVGLFIKVRYGMLLAVSNIVAALITQLLKHTLFSDVVRPKQFFEGLHQLNLVPWVENYLFNSFPSGHTTAAFATCCSLAFMIKNHWLKMLCFVTALTIGFSRVYLSQHFFNDIYAGSFIGVSVSFLVFYFMYNSPRLTGKTWYENPLLLRR